jgi:hypothetical protein
MSGRFIDVDQPQTNQPSEVTFADILAAINKDRGIVPDGYRAVQENEPTRRSQRQQGGGGESIDDLVKSTLQSLVEKVAETDKKQRSVEVVLTAMSARMKQMDAEHKKFNQWFQTTGADIDEIKRFISSVRVDPPPPPPPQPIPPLQQPSPQQPQQQYAAPSAPPQPQPCWPYRQN